MGDKRRNQEKTWSSMRNASSHLVSSAKNANYSYNDSTNNDYEVETVNSEIETDEVFLTILYTVLKDNEEQIDEEYLGYNKEGDNMTRAEAKRYYGKVRKQFLATEYIAQLLHLSGVAHLDGTAAHTVASHVDAVKEALGIEDFSNSDLLLLNTGTPTNVHDFLQLRVDKWMSSSSSSSSEDGGNNAKNVQNVQEATAALRSLTTALRLNTDENLLENLQSTESGQYIASKLHENNADRLVIDLEKRWAAEYNALVAKEDEEKRMNGRRTTALSNEGRRRITKTRNLRGAGAPNYNNNQEGKNQLKRF